MNLLHGEKFSPWEDFFVNPFGSDVISPNPLCKCTCMYRCWSKHMRWNNEVEYVSLLEYNCFVYYIIVPIVVGIMSSVSITKSSKKRTRDK